MALRAFSKPIHYLMCIRSYSNSSKFLNTSFEDKTNVATVTMQREPVNSLNCELLKELKTVLDDLQKKKIKGLILTSSLSTIFSAGLDIMEMYKPDIERAKSFWLALQDAWLALYTTPYPTVAAINGHSPAGGCLLAMACEYRIMVNNYNIGLNETKLGIVAPFWFSSAMENIIGTREHELALTSGRLYSTEEALKVKLIDEVVNSKEEALLQSYKFFKRFNGIQPQARTITKLQVREKLIKEFQGRRDEDLQTFLSFLQEPTIQKGLEVYLQSLKKK